MYGVPLMNRLTVSVLVIWGHVNSCDAEQPDTNSIVTSCEVETSTKGWILMRKLAEVPTEVEESDWKLKLRLVKAAGLAGAQEEALVPLAMLHLELSRRETVRSSASIFELYWTLARVRMMVLELVSSVSPPVKLVAVIVTTLDSYAQVSVDSISF